MKLKAKRAAALLLLFVLFLTGCGAPDGPSGPPDTPGTPVTDVPPLQDGPKLEPNTPTLLDSEDEPPAAGFDLSQVPAYAGDAYVAVNQNSPYFLPEELTGDSFENYSPLDSLGRCGAAFANVCLDTMPTEERGNIGMVKPSGWQTVKYDCVDGKYLYNRCHLIGYQLTAENANTENLITGTRYLNISGMLPFENLVADYVKETGHHVAYRVTPVFQGDNLVASGVLMEGLSIEDQGEGVSFCVYAYNVQPGVEIDYATGDSRLAEGGPKSPAGPDANPAQSGGQTPANTPEPEPPAAPSPVQDNTNTYIVNLNTGKFHYPGCSSVDQMKESNKWVYTGTAAELIGQGYSPCKRCDP